MLSMKALIRFLDRGFLLRSLLLLMLYSLVPFGESFLLLMLNAYLGIYLLLAMVASSTLLGFFLIVRPITAILAEIDKSVEAGYFPDEPFAMLAGTLVSAVLLLTPGFVTDTIGLLIFLPFLRRWVGRLITKRMDSRLKGLYEYIKL